jgi:hypothetical protein
MAPPVTFSDMYEGIAYQGGAKVLHFQRQGRQLSRAGDVDHFPPENYG